MAETPGKGPESREKQREKQLMMLYFDWFNQWREAFSVEQKKTYRKFYNLIGGDKEVWWSFEQGRRYLATGGDFETAYKYACTFAYKHYLSRKHPKYIKHGMSLFGSFMNYLKQQSKKIKEMEETLKEIEAEENIFKNIDSSQGVAFTPEGDPVKAGHPDAIYEVLGGEVRPPSPSNPAEEDYLATDQEE